MIIHLKSTYSAQAAQILAEEHQAILLQQSQRNVLVTSASIKRLPTGLEAAAEEVFYFESDLQLANRNYQAETRSVRVGPYVLGGAQKNTLLIAGPCAVESEQQIRASAELLVSLGLRTLRAGCFKPRTSPYSFQGMGLKGLQLLDRIRTEYGLQIVTEVRDATHVDAVIDHADVVQVGAKAMYDQGILRACSKANKPVLLKRGFGSTLQEFVQAAEFILSGGNEQVMLCERGIRTFESKTRFTLDLCGLAWLKAHTNLPVVLDPSHAMGHAFGVPDLARACVAMGVDGLLIETHQRPTEALSDAAQQLDHQAFQALFTSLKPVAVSIYRNLI